MKEFESWAYEQPRIEEVMGEDLYYELISTSYRSPTEVERLKGLLQAFAEAEDDSPCRCVRVANLDVIDMGHHEEEFRTLELVQDRGDTYWWLSVYRCQVCGQGWMVASEERQNDVFCLRRLSDQEFDRVLNEGAWPTDFDRYEDLLRIGLTAGKRVRFVEPYTSSLRWTIADLARERPGIGVSELAQLLNLDCPLCRDLARLAVEEEGVDVDFEE